VALASEILSYRYVSEVSVDLLQKDLHQYNFYFKDRVIVRVCCAGNGLRSTVPLIPDGDKIPSLKKMGKEDFLAGQSICSLFLCVIATILRN
jgi:hypothetical protein